MEKVTGWSAWCVLCSAVGFWAAGYPSIAVAAFLLASFLGGVLIGLKIVKGGE